MPSHHIEHDEALHLLFLASLGMRAGDLPLIKKLGGIGAFLESDLVAKLVARLRPAEDLLRSLEAFARKLSAFRNCGGSLITPLEHPRSSLFKSKNAPLVFYASHNLGLMQERPRIGIVGSRRASEYGNAWAYDFSRTLAERGAVIVSGGATGIDSAAHQGAHDGHGGTIFVLGKPCDLNTDGLAFAFRHFIKEKLLTISPFGPYDPQTRAMFAQRNEYMSLLMDALVVVEGEEGSGTLHTIDFAKKYGVPIYAVPGRVGDPLSFVPNRLLQKKDAKAILSGEQFLHVEDIFKPRAKSRTPKREDNSRNNSELPYLLMVLKQHNNTLSMDEMLAITQRSFRDLQAELLEYEMAGKVLKRGGQFVLAGK